MERFFKIMSKKTIKKLSLILVFSLILVLFTSSCGSNNTSSNTVPSEDSVTLSMSEAADLANKSNSLWEMMCNMFPDYMVFKGGSGGYTFRAVDKSLPQNTYDWTDTSKALKGIDVSAYQGTIDWVKVSASDVGFAFVRVGYRGYSSGNLTLDDRFEYNVSSAVKVRIPVGVYFVTTAINEEEAVEEADWVLQQIEPYDITWPVVIDVEEAGGSEGRSNNLDAATRTKVVVAFCERIKAAGYTPMIYSNIGWFMGKLDYKQIAGYDIWFAQYFNQPHFPYAYQVWQAQSDGKISGIKVDVDINYSMFDYSKGKPLQ